MSRRSTRTAEIVAVATTLLEENGTDPALLLSPTGSKVGKRQLSLLTNQISAATGCAWETSRRCLRLALEGKLATRTLLTVTVDAKLWGLMVALVEVKIEVEGEFGKDSEMLLLQTKLAAAQVSVKQAFDAQLDRLVRAFEEGDL